MQDEQSGLVTPYLVFLSRAAPDAWGVDLLKGVPVRTTRAGFSNVTQT